MIWGEALTGDIPAFVKTDDDRKTEGDALTLLTAMLPGKERQELDELFGELEREETMEAKIVHALDKMETLIQHNEADIATWLPLGETRRHGHYQASYRARYSRMGRDGGRTVLHFQLRREKEKLNPEPWLNR